MTEPLPTIPPGLAPLGVDPGPPDNHHRAAGTMGCFTAVIGMCLFGGAFFSLAAYASITSKYANNHQLGWLFLIFMAIPSLLTGIGLFFWHKNQTSMEVWTTPQGIAWRSAFRKGFARWDDVTAHYRKVMEIYHQGRHVRTNIFLTIETSNGQRVTFRDFVQYVLDLANRIDREIVARRLTAAITRARAGEPVPFGKVALSKAGVGWGRHLLPWSDVESTEIAHGWFTVRKRGKWLSWASIQVGDLPNLPLFLAILKEVQPAPPAPKP